MDDKVLLLLNTSVGHSPALLWGARWVSQELSWLLWGGAGAVWRGGPGALAPGGLAGAGQHGTGLGIGQCDQGAVAGAAPVCAGLGHGLGGAGGQRLVSQRAHQSGVCRGAERVAQRAAFWRGAGVVGVRAAGGVEPHRPGAAFSARCAGGGTAGRSVRLGLRRSVARTASRWRYSGHRTLHTARVMAAVSCFLAGCPGF